MVMVLYLFQMESLITEDNQNVLLVSLLSEFIEKKWREQVKTDDDILMFVVTWNPMKNYFKRFGKAGAKGALKTNRKA